METYCVKCRGKTKSRSEKLENMKNGRYRMTGICTVCDAKKNTFVSKDGTFREKPDTERDNVREKKALAKQRKKALKACLKAMETQFAS
jgi:hypothetical protein